MTVPDQFVWIACTATLGIQGWTLREVINLKVNVATLTANQQAMKTPKKALLALIFATFLPLLFMGCGTGNFRFIVPTLETNTVSGAVQTNGFTAAPALQSGLDIAQKTSAFIPSPIGEGIAVVSSLLSGVLGFIVRRKNRMLTAVVNGVEDPGNNVKAAIADQAALEGVLKDLHAFVQLTTKGKK